MTKAAFFRAFRIVLSAAFLCLIAGSASAQLSTVSGTVTDTDGQTWNSATYSLTLSPQYSSGMILNGASYTPLAATGTLSAAGTFSIANIPINSYISDTFINPIITQWVLTVTPNASPSNPFVTTFTVSSSTQTLNLTPPAIRFPATNAGGNYGYADGEIFPTPVTGQKYFNVISGLERIWNGTAFQDNGVGQKITLSLPGQTNENYIPSGTSGALVPGPLSTTVISVAQNATYIVSLNVLVTTAGTLGSTGYVQGTIYAVDSSGNLTANASTGSSVALGQSRSVSLTIVCAPGSSIKYAGNTNDPSVVYTATIVASRQL